MASPFELLQFGHGRGVSVLLQRRPGDNIRDRVVRCSRDQQERTACLVPRVDFRWGVQREVGDRSLEQWLGRGGNGPFVEQIVGLFLGYGISEAESELLLGERYRLMKVGGVA